MKKERRERKFDFDTKGENPLAESVVEKLARGEIPKADKPRKEKKEKKADGKAKGDEKTKKEKK